MLVPFYRMGYVYHNPAVAPILEQQLLTYPRSKRWDVMDAFAYVIEMLEIGERYFSSEDKEEDPQAIEDEYKELDEDLEPVAQGWRCI
mgnify:CR=1 FL=1